MIVCIGETREEKEKGITDQVIFAQMKAIAGMQLLTLSLGFYVHMRAGMLNCYRQVLSIWFTIKFKVKCIFIATKSQQRLPKGTLYCNVKTLQ